MDRADQNGDIEDPQGASSLKSKVSYLSGVGTPHPLREEIERLRNFFLSAGFDEVENQIVVPRDEIFKQFGNEAYPVLSHTYLLGGFPGSERMITSERVWSWLIRENIASDVDVEMDAGVVSVLRSYRNGKLDTQDLVDELCEALSLDREAVAAMITELTNLKDRKAEVSADTLRSHMSSVWFPTIQGVLSHTNELPVKVFYVGQLFRKEERPDERNLTSYHLASCVVVDRGLDIDLARPVVEEILERIGITGAELRQKEWTTSYFEKDREYAIIFNDLEVGAFGIYSRKILSEYGIQVPVMALGVGVERLLMALKGYTDANEMLYPQFHAVYSMTDTQIANSLKFIHSPRTRLGKSIEKAIRRTYEGNREMEAPCRVPVLEIKMDQEIAKGLSKVGKHGPIEIQPGQRIDVYLRESEGNRTIAGPLMFGHLIVMDGGFQVQVEDQNSQNSVEGIPTGIRPLDAFARYAAWKIERNIAKGRSVTEVKMVRSLEDINLEIDPAVRQYLITNNRMINVKGPLLARVIMKVRDAPEDSGSGPARKGTDHEGENMKDTAAGTGNEKKEQ